MTQQLSLVTLPRCYFYFSPRSIRANWQCISIISTFFEIGFENDPLKNVGFREIGFRENDWSPLRNRKIAANLLVSNRSLNDGGTSMMVHLSLLAPLSVRCLTHLTDLLFFRPIQCRWSRGRNRRCRGPPPLLLVPFRCWCFLLREIALGGITIRLGRSLARAPPRRWTPGL